MAKSSALGTAVAGLFSDLVSTAQGHAPNLAEALAKDSGPNAVTGPQVLKAVDDLADRFDHEPAAEILPRVVEWSKTPESGAGARTLVDDLIGSLRTGSLGRDVFADALGGIADGSGAQLLLGAQEVAQRYAPELAGKLQGTLPELEKHLNSPAFLDKVVYAAVAAGATLDEAEREYVRATLSERIVPKLVMNLRGFLKDTSEGAAINPVGFSVALADDLRAAIGQLRPATDA
ncbi:MAG: hypothetical protein AAF654_12715 [Myxococcota bacterium]